MDYQSLLLNLGELFVLDDNDVDDDGLIMWIMSMGEPSFYSIGMMKDKGNSLFKEGNLSLAVSLYKLALNFFGFLCFLPSQDQPAAFTLAISLVLNLAACELKLSHYKQAWSYCNLVLKFDPSSVKALYRRGFALKNLNLLDEALVDFEHSLKLDPNNKDVAREFRSVTESLHMNSNGKRLAFQFDPLGSDRKGKKPLLNADMDIKIVPLDSVSTASCSKVELLDSEISCEQAESGGSSGAIMDSTTVYEPYPPSPLESESNPSVSFAPGSSKFSFFNKKQAHKKLYLSSKDYENLMLGRNLQFYHPKSGASMRVRPLFTKPSTLMGTPLETSSREAAVPAFSVLPMNHYAAMDVSAINANNFDDDDEVNPHQVKRPRLSSEGISDHVSEVTEVAKIEGTFLDQPGKVNLNSIRLPCESQFVFSAFTALKTRSSRACSRFKENTFSRQCSRRVRANFKGKSMLMVRSSCVFCSFTGGLEMVSHSKRKAECSIHFDYFYHPPIKKRRLCVLDESVCKSYASCAFVSSGVSTGPRFVI